MTALTAATRVARPVKNDGNICQDEYGVKASAVCIQGGLAMLDTGGYVVPAADTSNCKVVGIFDESVTGTSADGGATVRVLSGATWKFAASSVVVTNMDAPLLYVVDDNTVDETSPANSVKAGIYVWPYISATEVWMYIPPYGVHTYGL
jgi:hypothetical protein